MKKYITPPRLSTSFSRRAAQIKRRFENILDTRVKRTGAAVCAAMAAILFISAGCLARRAEPVFLTHYYDMPAVAEGRNIALHYITDLADKRKITSVEFPQCPELNIAVAWDSRSAYPRYAVCSVVCQAAATTSDNAFGPVEINTARVTFSDGTTGDFDIGRIIAGNASPVSGLLADKSTYGSNQGVSGSDKRVLKDCTLTDITSDFDGGIGADVKIKLSGEMPIAMREGDIVSFGAEISVDKEHRLDVYNLDQTLVLTDSGGNTAYEHLWNITYTPDLSYRDIRRIMQERN